MRIGILSSAVAVGIVWLDGAASPARAWQTPAVTSPESGLVQIELQQSGTVERAVVTVGDVARLSGGQPAV